MKKTGIEWTDRTWNPLRGCSKVSEGCRNCYAMSVAHRFSGEGMPYEGLTRIVAQKAEWNGKIMLLDEKVSEPYHWKKPVMIFVNSMSDLFHEDVPFEFIYKVFETMFLSHWHTFQVLTKRPERMSKIVPDVYFHLRRNYGQGMPESQSIIPQNVWLGTSVENQAAADERIPFLLKTPAYLKFLSMEPLLGPVDLDRELGAFSTGNDTPFRSKWLNKIDWVIVGGESGPKARPMHPDWVRSLRDQCQYSFTPFFFKQWGEFAPTTPGMKMPKGSQWVCVNGDTESALKFGPFKNETLHYELMAKVGKKSAGRHLDDEVYDEMPAGVEDVF